jgi:uncharacterized protein YjbI with pentapeptide repeats
MSLPKVAILFLRLISVGAGLLTLLFAAAPFLISPGEELPGSSAGSLPAGCFSILVLLTLLPLSLVPAFVGWVIQERILRPREAAERVWRDAAAYREKRLQAWTSYVTDLLLRHRRLRATAEDPAPKLLRAELPRALGELDRGRRERLVRFLREAELGDALQGGDHPIVLSAPDSEPATTPPRRGPVFLAAGILALVSTFFFLWSGLGLLVIFFANPFEALGLSYGRGALFLVGPTVLLIPALVCGLAAAGLRRMYRQAMRSIQEQEGDREIVQGLVMEGVRNQIELLAQWAKLDGVEIETVSLQIARASLWIAAPELDGLRRGELVRLLAESGWLSREKRVKLEGVDLRGAELAEVSLQRACLAGADLSGANLSGADFCEADLGQCLFRGSDLRLAQLQGANLRGADLRYARLQKANLKGANLREVLLDGANFWGTACEGAELTGAQGIAEHLPESFECLSVA